ncbi:glycoside hydrolase family 30 protein [Flavobacteriaceae bacterium 14752]|uniref:glycoside hydrolase family 30 protein n=1 Tax=Mesohalobacter salilacus TaxID=2491711 RepID=UPI000F641A98|nr:glycosyl hydrolase family 30 [Flavobacteriaceae bacterium 14752]
MKNFILLKLLIIAIVMSSCSKPKEEKQLSVQVFETSRSGNKLTEIKQFKEDKPTSKIVVDTSKTYQTISGFGGSFTEASAYLLNQLSAENRQKIIDAYFAETGAHYSLTRTHMNSCDFSLGQYSYAPVEGDKTLENFSIEEDKEDLIPMIKDAMKASTDGFKIISSPWTAPPWMKDNKDWVGGKLLPEYYDTWALFFSKYADAYKAEGIDIWGFTVENEPLGNDSNWESMHYTPKEMTDFVVNHLGPQLEKDGKSDLVILGYDQNREHLDEWVDEMYRDETSRKYFDGTAIHWYASTYKIFEDQLEYAKNKAPDKYLIETEGCIDAQIPVWKDDDWYWQKEATDWGWEWASEDNKHLHPKYRPVYRYARDIIGCLNNGVDGWIDWNMVLNRQGGPNWFENWCVAPVIVDENQDEVYFTPLYYTMAHFSKYVRPGAKRIAFDSTDEKLQVTAAQNPDGSIAVIVFNPTEEEKVFELEHQNISKTISISPQALQTIIL